MMRRPERPGEAGERLSPDAQRRVVPAAFLRPWGLLVLVIGAISFAMTSAWWIVPLTLATYAALVLLAARDPLFRTRALGKREIDPEETRLGSFKKDVSPKQRARFCRAERPVRR